MTFERPKFSKAQVDEAKKEWEETLAHFGQPRPLLFREHFAIERAVATNGFDPVRQALVGARHEPKSDTYDPADHVSLDRVFLHKNFLRFVGLGAKQDAKKKARQQRAAVQEQIEAQEPRAIEEEPLPPADPARVARIVEAAFAKNIKSPLASKPLRCQGAHVEGEQIEQVEEELEDKRFRITRFECRVCGTVFSRTERVA